MRFIVIKKERFLKHSLMILTVLLALMLGGCDWGTDPYHGEFALVFDPTSAVISAVGESGEVDVYVANAEALITARVTVKFNPAALQVTGIETEGEGFLFTDAGAEVNVLENTYDNSSGKIVIALGGLKEGFKGASGDGKIATITVKGLKDGYSFLSFDDSASTNTFLASYSSESSGWEHASIFSDIGAVRVLGNVVIDPNSPE